ncbi:MAG: flippase-like domain-containing protein [Thermodesulfovibrionia bacterium]|nr:flippase-like domain-containing protein [Thermodesulfovibrionia bacterium]
MRKKYLHLLIGLIIVVLSLTYAFKDVSLKELMSALKSVRLFYIFPALLMVAASYILRAMRWHYLIRSVKKVKTARLFSPLMVGFMGNMLPARAGEFIRAYLLGKKEQISFSASFATIFIERMFDMVIVLLLLVWVLLFKAEVFASTASGGTSKIGDMIAVFGWISVTGCSFIFAFSALLQYKKDWAMRFVDVFTRRLSHKWGGKINKLVHSFSDGLKIIKDRNGFLATVLLSFLIWSTFAVTYYPLYLAFDIDSKLPVLSSLLILCLTVAVFITMAPTPGFLGSFHAACVATLHGMFGIPKAVALSYGIVAWLVLMGFTVVVGSIFAVKDHISLGELSARKEEQTE